MRKHLDEDHPGCDPEDIKFGMTVVRQQKSAFSRMVHEEILIFMAKDKILNSKSMYNRCQIPRLSVMVGEEERRPPEEPEFDTAELVTELKKLKTNYSLTIAKEKMILWIILRFPRRGSNGSSTPSGKGRKERKILI